IDRSGGVRVLSAPRALPDHRALPDLIHRAAVAPRGASVLSAMVRCAARSVRDVPSGMLASIRSAAVLGIDAYDVLVEVYVAQGLPIWTIVGLPVGAVKESRERVSAALTNSGFNVPVRRVTVNLAPANIRKDGTAFDLPIALAFLVATGQLD